MPGACPRELMILVERVVRPVPVSLKRQKRTRDELIQHLQAVYAEELARDGDEAVALLRTQDRFGDPAALTAELRQAIPKSDRWRQGLEWCVMQRVEESIPRYALRLALLQTAMVSFLFLIAPWRLAIGVMSLMAVGFGGLLFFTFHWGHEWESRRRWTRLILFSVGGLASFPAGIATLLLVAGGNPWEIPYRWFHLAGACLLGMFLMPVVGVLHTRDMKYLREWAGVDVDFSPCFGEKKPHHAGITGTP